MKRVFLFYAGGMKSFLRSAILLLVLVGAGCRGYELGTIPTDAERARLTDAEKIEAMKAFVEREPIPTLSDEERDAERRLSWGVLAEGTPERFAEFQEGAFHARGTVRVVRAPDRRWTLVLMDGFQVDPAPRVTVTLLMRGTDGTTSVPIGPLKSHRGAQVYQLPPEIDASSIASIRLESVPFDAIVAEAVIK